MAKQHNNESDREQAGASAPAKGGSPWNVLHIAWRRKWWVVLTTLTSLAVAVVYLYRTTPIYSSSARIYVQQFSPMKSAGNDTLGGTAVVSPAAAQAELLRSESLLQTVAKLPEVTSMRTMHGIASPVAIIQAGLTVVNSGDFVRISFEAPFPEDASHLVNLIVQQYQVINDKRSRGDSAEVVKTLRAELEKADAELEEKTRESIEFRKKHGVLSFQDERGNIVLQRLSKLSEALTQAQLDSMEASANEKSVLALKDQPVKLLDLARAENMRDAFDSGRGTTLLSGDPLEVRLGASADALRSEIEAQERLLDRLKRTHTPEHKDVKDAQADLAILHQQLERTSRDIENRKERMVASQQRTASESQSVQAQLDANRQATKDQQLTDAYVTKVQRRAEIAKQRLDALQADFEKQKSDAFALNTVQAEYSTLDSDLKRAERLVEMLREKIKTIRVTEDTGIIRTSVVEVAKPSLQPVRPDRNRVIGTALLVGLLLGGGLAFTLDSMDPRLRSVEEITEVVDAPILGVIPHIDATEASSARGRKVQLEPTSDVAESYRTIRTAIYFADRDQSSKRLLVTSPAPGDGKSTTASNLAITMAQAGRRVVLIDADFRRPTQHKIFEIQGDAGMAGVMAGEIPLDAAIHRTGIDSLHVIPCGTLPANPAEILNGRGFADCLSQLCQMYDQVIIDSPPVAPVTDARILGALCDETLLVLRANKSTRRLTQYAQESLASVGARIIGVIVNDVPRRRDKNGYYYGYGYGYGYYQGSYRYGSDQPVGSGSTPAADSNGKAVAAAGRSVD